MKRKPGLKKVLGLFDVFAISTGAMFGSGFFLLPGIASQFTGPSVFIAYLLAGILVLPAMFSMAEISTALPRSGGAYYFLDRGLGPLIGTVGGLGTYLAMLLKTAFAIIGIGAYGALFWDIPVKTVAILATVFFTIINMAGAKKTSVFQNYLVLFLLLVLGLFVIDGAYYIIFENESNIIFDSMAKGKFFTHGIDGILITTGFVFVSYLGLTEISSVAEEIKNPERNIPLGMLLSLLVTGSIYFIGVSIMVALINPAEFAIDLTPAATAAKKLFSWMPGNLGGYLMIGAAMAAFASTGNAGILSTSRYPFAMSRDSLFPKGFSRLDKNGIPRPAIILTAAIMIFFILTLSESGIARLASTFQLIIFILVNFAVIVFRKSKIESYDPSYHSPFYPAMQIIGIIISIVLIGYMGWVAILFSAGIIAASLIWYYYYAREKVHREGAIFHWFAILGKNQYVEIENEFMTILKEKGLRQGDPFDQTIIRSRVTRLDREFEFEDLVKHVSWVFSTEMHANKDSVFNEFMSISPIEPALVIPEVSILYAKQEGIDHPSLQIVLSESGIRKPIEKGGISSHDDIKVFFFLVNPKKESKQQLRMLSRLVDIIEREQFVNDILSMENHRKIKEYMLHNDRFISLQLLPKTIQGELIGKQLKDIRFPSDVLVALVESGDRTFAPHGNTVLKENDVLTIIGEPRSINQMFNTYLATQIEN